MRADEHRSQQRSPKDVVTGGVLVLLGFVLLVVTVMLGAAFVALVVTPGVTTTASTDREFLGLVVPTGVVALAGVTTILTFKHAWRLLGWGLLFQPAEASESLAARMERRHVTIAVPIASSLATAPDTPRPASLGDERCPPCKRVRDRRRSWRMMRQEASRLPARSAKGAAVSDRARSFEDFFHDEHARLFRALCMVTGSRVEAEEIMQDTFLRLWERWDRVARLEDPRGYLYRSAMNVFRSRYRSAMRAFRRLVPAAPRDDAFAAIEDRDVVVRALRTLIPQQRAAVVLTALLGYSSEEAGEMLGLRASTVRALSTRAREAMRRSVGEDA